MSPLAEVAPHRSERLHQYATASVALAILVYIYQRETHTPIHQYASMQPPRMTLAYWYIGVYVSHTGLGTYMAPCEYATHMYVEAYQYIGVSASSTRSEPHVCQYATHM